MTNVIIACIMMMAMVGCSREEKLPDIDEARKQQLAAARKLNSKATDAQVNQFLDKMKEAVKTKNGAAFSKLLQYPCNLNEGKQHIVLKNEAEFLPHASRVRGAVRDVVLKACIDDIFVNYLGFMLGSGEVWFDPLQGIITFNLAEAPEGSTILNSLYRLSTFSGSETGSSQSG